MSKKDIEIFEGKSLSDVFKDIYDMDSSSIDLAKEFDIELIHVK